MPKRYKYRELDRIVRNDGWQLHRTRGSHGNYRHPTKPGTVTIPQKFNAVAPPKTAKAILKQARIPNVSLKQNSD
ncbi:MAG: type II toxin-antitoxin system HicA family toxin [Gammaproteobacteria bacterium]|nr:type II toxin-antitoxin system HicA family toxin [Gammaproteobacteria bacterium]MDD9814970.1 type II toxin-antitoxin system HicA family toxin [Gammaproteobacteria bacterium]MDD9850168.1 type II toxin-antitoxin system HicA family toxin [Gammaproteobacteria bacterium]MDD9871233.1 type II toxin-antitoxin system HicA family toxin [Gammaproteobacteria bacterium]